MNNKPTVLVVIALLALAGLSAATYVFVAHSLGYRLFCPFATGCDTVQDSPYAVILGIPVSLLGMMGFAIYFVLAVTALRSNAREWRYGLLGLSLVEVGFTSYMAYLQVSVIRAVCSWCMFSAAVTVALAMLVLLAIFGGSGRAGAAGD